MSALDDELNELTDEIYRREMREDEQRAFTESEENLTEAIDSLESALGIAKSERTRVVGEKIDSRDLALIAEVLAAGLDTFAKTAVYCVHLSWRYKRGLDNYR